MQVPYDDTWVWESSVLRKAMLDLQFRQSLLQQPLKTLASIGITMPPHIQIYVVEENPGSLLFVLPPKPNQSTKLTETQLNEMAQSALSFQPWEQIKKPRD